MWSSAKYQHYMTSFRFNWWAQIGSRITEVDIKKTAEFLWFSSRNRIRYPLPVCLMSSAGLGCLNAKMKLDIFVKTSEQKDEKLPNTHILRYFFLHMAMYPIWICIYIYIKPIKNLWPAANRELSRNTSIWCSTSTHQGHHVDTLPFCW